MVADVTYSTKIQMRDGGDKLAVASGGTLDIETGGALTMAGSDIAAPLAALAALSAAELAVLDAVTPGTAAASKAVVLSASKQVDTVGINLLSVGAAGVETGITAHAGGTQAAALALSATKSVHDVTTVGSAADSVKLPLATGSGNIHWVKNSAAANSLQLYGDGTDTIDGVATATGVAIAAGKSRVVVDIAAGLWVSLLGA